ncbi:MAG: hypothetical protein HFI86_06400 [Bacilli bacterium]|nr:hypothetical protein [Bacilli bacterium]MCI9434880.1 hypothetical protein [Bacilli bacterium]
MENTDIYKFIGADIDPTVRRFENGQPTTEIFNKEKVYRAIEAAIKDCKITETLKIEDNSQAFIKYIFSNKKDKVEVLISNPNFNKGFVKDIYNSKLVVDEEQFGSKYIKRFDDLIKLRVKVRNEHIALILVTGIVVVGMVGGGIYNYFKGSEINAIKNERYVEETTIERGKNGVGPIQYAWLEETVDEVIDEESLGARKL